MKFQEDPFNYLDGAPKICPPLDITDTDSDKEVSTVGQQITTPKKHGTTAIILNYFSQIFFFFFKWIEQITHVGSLADQQNH